MSSNMGRMVLKYGVSCLGPSFNWGELSFVLCCL